MEHELRGVTDAQRLPDLCEGARVFVIEPVAEPEDGALPLCESGSRHGTVEAGGGGQPIRPTARLGYLEIREHIGEPAPIVRAEGFVEGDAAEWRVEAGLGASPLGRRDPRRARYLGVSRVATQRRREIDPRPADPGPTMLSEHRECDGAPSSKHGEADVVPDPVLGVGGEAGRARDPAAGCNEQADTALLDEIEERDARLLVPLGDADSEVEVGFDEAGLRLAVAPGDPARQRRFLVRGEARDARVAAVDRAVCSRRLVGLPIVLGGVS
jgi:hypothetical protein